MDVCRPYDVVVVTFNHAATLGACLRAVACLHPAPQRVVVVDNASTDGSAAEARNAAAALPLEIVESSENTGFAAGCNLAIARGASPWVLLLNPDCAPRPDFVSRLLAAVADRPESGHVGAATGRLLRATGDQLAPDGLIDAAGMVVTVAGRHFDRGAGEPDDGRYTEPAWVFGGTAAATVFRRSALEDVAYSGGEVLAESFFSYREDAELAWRLQWRGWRCLYVPDAVAAHGRGFRPEQGRAGHATTNRHSVRNRFLIRVHCADLAWHLTSLPAWLIRDALVVGACLTIERDSAGALLEAWRLRHDAMRRRRWVLGRATAPSRRVRAWFRKPGRVQEISAT